MFLSGYRVSYMVRSPWYNHIEHKYFYSHDMATQFLNSVKANEPKIEAVAFVIIENKAYCIGATVQVT